MNQETKQLIDLIESWEKGYLPPSAQIVLRDSKNMILSKDQEIAELSELVEELEKMVEDLKSGKEIPHKNDSPEAQKEEEQKAPTSKRSRKNAI